MEMVKKPLSVAERCRRYREKLKLTNPAKFEELKKKNAERTKAKKRKISDMNEDEKTAIRTKWRDAKRKKKESEENESEKKKEENESEKKKAVISTERQRRRRKYRCKLRRENRILMAKYKFLNRKYCNLQRALSRHRKTINTLTDELNKLKSENNYEHKKRPDTPITKFLEEETPDISEASKEKIRKRMLESRVVEESLKEIYKACKSNTEKNVLKKLIFSEMAQKTKMQGKIRKCLGLKNGLRKYYSNKQKKMRTMKEIKQFFERDDVSRMTAGKQDCLTRKKVTKQKRVLLNTLSNLYKLYKKEGGVFSKATFKRYRPFNVVPPHVSDRNTCACSKHANLAFKAKTLKKWGLILSADPSDLVSEIVCDVKTKCCMYSECTVCSSKKLSFALAADDREVSWFEWTTRTHEYEKSGVRKTTKKTVKEKRTGSLITLANLIQEDLEKFKRHHFNIYHQYKQYRKAIKKIQENEVIIHCDFSENYECKMAEEVQSMHFSGSKQQITLHTGVAYVKNEDPIPFCTISPSLKHDPQAIWGHLKPVIDFGKVKFPAINCVHFYSDGPTTQYRQKKNFCLFAEKTKEAGFEQATWNFFEASHGKGAADGIGGATKRTLDGSVAYGEDVIDAKSAFEVLSKTDTTINLFYVSEEMIENISIPENIIPVPDTMKIHQIIATEDKHVIKYRPLSCFCKRGNCNCFSPKMHNFFIKNTIKHNKMRETETESCKEIKEKGRRYDKIRDLETGLEDEYKKVKISSEVRMTQENKPLVGDVPLCLKPVKNTIKHHKTIETETESCKEIKEKGRRDEKIRGMKTGLEDGNKKVKVLSEVRMTQENRPFVGDMPLCLKPVSTNFDLFTKKDKENIVIANSDPCTSKDEHINYTENDEMCPNDSILVRYFERSKWKYYIGFIDKIEIKDNDTLYVVRFLKTVNKNGELKFIVPKKKKYDIVTCMSIAKKIQLSHLKRSGEYCLTEDCDKIYF